ncbi:hypothetical protein DPX39_040089800 [Trypanosoma brucei equiperdum]|uniref:Trypanosomal VSG domain containing protein n=1 Tax=Trypanosoma brucei equiperdum TaxID=630700 RepID=A0A3L6L9Q5_9TRYP|nr:hypothetical protein DPX39_040089800 [Trypanosoma brucei equiperdum]
MSKGKGSGNNVGILGTIAGAGSGACSGDHSTNNGACMFAGATDGKPTTPAWLTQLKVAASEARQAETQLDQIMIEEAQLTSDNNTLSALMATALAQAETAATKGRSESYKQANNDLKAADEKQLDGADKKQTNRKLPNSKRRV